MRRLKLLLGVFLAVLIVACGGGGDPGTNSTSSTIPLFTTAPDTLTLAPGASQEFTIGGGKAPYSAASDNSAIAIVWVNGNLLDVGGVAAGTAGVTIRDSAGASVKVALSVSSSPAKVLYTTAPSSITVAIGSAWAQTYSIDGGTGPYTVTSSNTLIATVAMAGNNYIVTGVSAGTTNILIRDSAGGTVNVSVSVAVASSLPLYTTAPPSLTLGIGPVGADQPYLVGGGTGPYTATSDNSNVAAVSLQGVNLTITGLTAGSASIFVRDSAGTIVTLRVTVVGAAIVPLFTTAPPSVTIAISSTQTYGVGGGTGPYTATSNNVSVADVALVGNSLKVTGITAGAANVVIRDSQGATVNVAVTVPAASTVPLFTTAPPSVTIAISSTQTYGVGGGTGPYTATSSNASVADVSLVGNSLKVTGITAGAANVVIRDSQGATVNVAVTVPAASTVPLFTTAPPSVTIAIGSTQTYGVGGGTGPYTATSSNASVADVSLVGNSLTVTGITAGAANVVIRDSQGATVNVAVTVPAASTVPLYTTAPPSVTIAIGSTQTYGVGGGTGPYTATTSNSTVADVSLVGNSLKVLGLKAGSASIVVRDAVGASTTVAVTVGLTPLSVTPNSATGIIDDILVATIVGGAPPYRASVGNILVATASIVGSDQLTIQLKQTGQTVITVLDANNQSAPYSVTSNAATPGIRLSPSVLTVSEKDNQAITLSVYGATGSISVFSSDIALLRAAVVGSKVSVTTGSNGTRCVAANTPVVITVVDSTGASALATVTIADNGTCP
jgi:hypothetical protein